MAFKQKPPLFFKTSVKGYRKDSPDKNEPKLKIPSNKISMEDVNHKVHGKDNLGNEKIMKPGKNYEFPGDYVVETPLRETVGDKIKILKKEGYPQKQAVAIALDMKEKRKIN
tara:strand:+ start:844 stop:1179 length:336 start_codon:yes stop_codon:yes gene_type:complete